MQDEPQTPVDDVITWTASEFIAHEKSAGWYGSLFGCALLAAAIVYLLIRDIISAIVVLVGAGFLAVYAGRQPRQLQYQVDQAGFTIGGKRFSYDEFRSFSIAPEGAFSSIVLMPLKRFATTATLYFAPADEDRIMAVLSAHLPFEEHRADIIDNFMRRIRF